MQQLITGLLLDAQIPLNMFQASLCPSSGAYQLQQQPLVYSRNVVVALLDAQIPLNMFRASLCPSSGAYQLQQQPLFYSRNVVVALLPPRSCCKPDAAAVAVDRLQMMGIRMPETC
jgi:hypothetical protein